MNILKLKNISKFYENLGARIYALDDINLEIPLGEKGKIISILAPEGSGKTTLLKIIAKAEAPTGGEIISNNIIPLIPEKPSSFLWLNVKENIELAGKLSGKEKGKSLNEIISQVGLTGYENHTPHAKSIGFRFRISLARALFVSPEIILIDDSLKLMRQESREEIQQHLLSIINSTNISILLATTNISEALRISSKIYLMRSRPGKIFKEIIIDRSLIDKAEHFVEQRKQIENYFVEEKILGKIHFSV